MKQIYNMSTEEIREQVKQYMEYGVISRVVQCFEHLKWLGKLRQHEYLLLSVAYLQKGKRSAAVSIIKRYNIIYM